MSDFYAAEQGEHGWVKGHVGEGTAAKGRVVGSSQEFPALLHEQRARQAQVEAETSWLSLAAAAQASGIHPKQLEEHARAGRLLAAYEPHDPQQRLRISASSLKANSRALRHRQVTE